jgi:hypothetical protein
MNVVYCLNVRRTSGPLAMQVECAIDFSEEQRIMRGVVA